MQGYIDPGKIPFKVQAVASALKEGGGKPFIVGGSIRDIMLGKNPSDWDIAVDLSPGQVLSIFPGACTVGIQFGRVSLGDVDVVSLRAEKEYADRRHPDEVTFGVAIEKDLERRDFTVNAMAWDPFSGEVFDPYGGLYDLKRRALTSVGEPLVRFQEDPLRILRAVRFKNTLGFNLDPGVVQAISESKGLLTQLSGERIFVELKQLLLSPSVYRGIMDLYDYGLSSIMLPEIGKAPEAVAKALSLCSPDLTSRLAVLLGVACVGLPRREDMEQLKARFNLPAAMAQDVVWLALNSLPEGILNKDTLPGGLKRLWKDEPEFWGDPGYIVRRIVFHWGAKQLERLLDVKQAIWRGMGNAGIPRGCLFLASGLWVSQRDWPLDFQAFRVALGGDDIMELLDIKEGHAVGQALEYLEEMALRFPDMNDKESLSKILLEWWNRNQ